MVTAPQREDGPGLSIGGFVLPGVPSGDEWLFLIPMIAAPVCSIIALLCSTGDSWLPLYFKRKALEEKKKIEALNDKNQS